MTTPHVSFSDPNDLNIMSLRRSSTSTYLNAPARSVLEPIAYAYVGRWAASRGGPYSLLIKDIITCTFKLRKHSTKLDNLPLLFVAQIC